MEGNPKKRGKAFSEVQALGYEIVPIDINYAEKNWTILKGKKFMPSFRSCKGIGDTAIDEIVVNRPYKSIYDIFWHDNGKWKLSKFNKKAVESLIRIQALESMDIIGPGRLFESYKHVYESIIPNWSKLRKSLKKNPFEGRDLFTQAVEETAGCGEWTRMEIIKNDMDLFGSVSVEKIVPPSHLVRFTQEGWLPLDEYAGKYFYWFIVISQTVRVTKTGKQYLRLKVMGQSGKQEWMNVWSPPAQTKIDPYTICVAEVAENPFGKSTRWFRLEIFSE